MREETNRIDESHRKELLKFLLVKTAAVRQGIKPAELLRVRHCYSGVNSEGLRVCLYRSDIYCILGLDYVELNPDARRHARRASQRQVAGTDGISCGHFAGRERQIASEDACAPRGPGGRVRTSARGGRVYRLSAQGRGWLHAKDSRDSRPSWGVTRVRRRGRIASPHAALRQRGSQRRPSARPLARSRRIHQRDLCQKGKLRKGKQTWTKYT